MLTVLCKTQNGNEKGEVESEQYKTVSFSAPKIIASSNSIAETEPIAINFNEITLLTKWIYFQMKW